MEELLTIAQGLPRRSLEPGEVLLVDDQPVPALYVLLEGELRIEKSGMPIATVRDRGACVGEMSLLLGIAATADVVASTRARVAVVDDPHVVLQNDPQLPIALARLLAERVHVMTSYLADIKQQYGDHEGGLGMVDVVLGNLMQATGPRSVLGSERDPDPEY